MATEAAEQFHTFQVEALAEAKVDFLLASTLPACSEAQGMATAMARTGLPYVLSFVIRRDGTLLDGTPLSQAIAKIDDTSPKPPTGYGVNCVHPAVFRAGLAVLERDGPGLSRRIVSFQANTSARDPKELDGRSELETESPVTLANAILEAYRQFRTPFLAPGWAFPRLPSAHLPVLPIPWPRAGETPARPGNAQLMGSSSSRGVGKSDWSSTPWEANRAPSRFRGRRWE